MMNRDVNDPTESLAHLTRLSQKPGVLATLILSRTTGAIVRSSGLFAEDSLSTAAHNNDELGSPDRRRTNTIGELKSAREVATAVWNFFKSSDNLIEQMIEVDKSSDGRDEVKLLRLRLRRKEIVVVPGMFVKLGLALFQD